MVFVKALLIGYLLGSIPFGYLVSRYWKNIDIRKHGSGNIGFTNVLRVLGPFPAAVTLIGDITKGYLAVRLGDYYGGQVTIILSALSVLIGHSFPVFLGFKGGKVIAAGLGVFLSMDWRVALIGLGTWLVVVAFTRYVSLASIAAALSVPISIFFFNDPLLYLIFGIAAALFAILRHRTNIKRLLEGKEFKIGEKPE